MTSISISTDERFPKRRPSSGVATLAGAAIPGVAFGLFLLLAARIDPRFAWVTSAAKTPWPVFVIALSGTLGLCGTTADFLYHRATPTPIVGAPEHRAHLLALFTGGVPLFLTMAAATLSQRPLLFLVPVIALAISVTVWVAYDEYVFHRRRKCSRLEKTFHLMANLGNAGAFLAWVQWIFVNGGAS